MTYRPPVREHRFLLRDVLEIDKLANLPGFAEAPIWPVMRLDTVMKRNAKKTASTAPTMLMWICGRATIAMIAG